MLDIKACNYFLLDTDTVGVFKYEFKKKIETSREVTIFILENDYD